MVALGALAALAIYLVILGYQMRHTYTADIVGCQPATCTSARRDFAEAYGTQVDLTGALLLGVPALIGERFGALTFASRNIAPIGYATFAFLLGTVIGLLVHGVHRPAEPALQLHVSARRRYWRFQWIELSAFLGLALVLTGFGLWRIRTYSS